MILLKIGTSLLLREMDQYVSTLLDPFEQHNIYISSVKYFEKLIKYYENLLLREIQTKATALLPLEKGYQTEFWASDIIESKGFSLYQ